MKTLMIVCAGGATSSLMAQNVVKSAVSEGLDAVLVFPEDVKYHDRFRENFGERDLVVVMGPVGAITAGKFHDYKEQVDAVLVAPQVKYMYKTVEEVLGELEIPCANINSLDFGRMRGDKILVQGLGLIDQKNSK
ncbi:Phosphotransferase system cellobiose-specific component IIB [Listeria ivanovii subsp. londoniensis]|uniref:PTS sugar transporter subunit IIB n=2 Tax=Listeria ivanovii TaxID=1638 RepID=A0ABS1G158_LISIV|nr:PTS IIB component [Listeria ivanovii]EFR97344.1 PTS system, IIB component, putative [Listeria ivanovii FSL F6-596]AIS59513.1 PTS lactose transporter subunit IIBC [Listeria ivanovii subsp. londoniensis]MBK1960617.1 PTS sugar transporter subunit IIB [Listeria ivanovii subsp. londoniensis]MBK2003144.1 PTS sugar transporter subunit IIB [Listeria ivanovii subsp. londoniensis]MBM5719319.1 PTS sugar transporter subunit IIB [Listeria ivanovii]